MATLERFVIDPKASRFSVKAVASGMTAGLGHSPISIREFDGEAQFVPGTLDAASLTGSGHEIREELKFAFFIVARQPDPVGPETDRTAQHAN